jgi:tyrosyl-tRNA synthetase
VAAVSPEGAKQLDFLAELSWRGLVQEQSEGLAVRLSRGPISGYVGFDASAPSLHVGHLLQVFLLTHLQRSGGRPVIVLGGATGMIGDPSGRTGERKLLDDAAIEKNAVALRTQLERFVDFTPGPSGAVMVDNREWLGRYTLLDFLRKIGKHFPLPYMLAKESVRLRLEQGMSFTEFSYMTLQAADFLHLYRERDVELQMGGADQWGNITAGLELIRRVEGRSERAERPEGHAQRADGAEGEDGGEPAFGLCSPLLLTRTGQKMGKSESGAVFLDSALTSPFEFFQYWLNDDDQLVGSHLRWLTLLSSDEIRRLEDEQTASPEARPAQRALAFDLTARVHGRDEAERQVEVARAAFSGQPITDPAILEVLYEHLDHFEFTDSDLLGSVLRLAVSSGLYPSISEARRQIQQGGFSINGDRITSPDGTIPPPIAGRYLVLRSGRRHLRIGRLAPED